MKNQNKNDRLTEKEDNTMRSSENYTDSANNMKHTDMSATATAAAPEANDTGEIRGYFTMDGVYFDAPRDGDGCELFCTLKTNQKVIFASFADYSGDISCSDNGSIVYAEGQMQDLDEPECVLSTLRKAAKDEKTRYKVQDLYPCGRLYGVRGLMRLLDAVHDRVKDNDYVKLAMEVICHVGDIISTCPMSLDKEYACVGGVLTHAYELLELAYQFGRYFVETYGYELDMDLLCAGAALLDVGLTEEYLLNNCDVAVVPYKHNPEMDHTQAASRLIAYLGEEYEIDTDKVERLSNVVESHHYNGHFGSGQPPFTPEAELLAGLNTVLNFTNHFYGGNITCVDGEMVYMDHAVL